MDFIVGGEITPPPKSKNGKWIPVLGDVAAGIPIEAVENIIDWEEINSALAGTGDFFGLRIKGSSMEPRIREDDVVIVRKQEDANTGDTAVVLVNGDSATVKRIKKSRTGGFGYCPTIRHTIRSTSPLPKWPRNPSTSSARSWSCEENSKTVGFRPLGGNYGIILKTVWETPKQYTC